MVSNMINTFAIPTQQIIGGFASGAGMTKESRKAMLQGIRTMRGIVAERGEAVQSALKALYNDESILDPFNGKLEIPEGSLSDNKFVKFVDKTVSLPSRFLMGMDEFFKQANYRGKNYADAAWLADVDNLKGAERKAFIEKYMLDSFDESGAGTRGEAMLTAQRATFTEGLEDPLSLMLQKAAVESNLVRFVVPFVRTPLNVLSQGFQQIPVLGMLSGRWRRDFMAGGERRAQVIGKQVIGASLATTGVALAANGIITGSGSKDPAVRREWLKNHQPYSFRVTNDDGSITWVPYQRYEPASYVLALIADMYEIFEYGDATDQELSEVSFAVVAAIAENTVNKTFTKGLNDFFGALTDTENKAQGVIENIAGSFVPNIIPQMLNDQEQKEIRGVVDAVKNRVGMDSEIDRKRTFVGEIATGYGKKYHPLGGKRIPSDALQNEMTRLAEVHKGGFALPVSKVGDVDLKDEMYSETQSLYDKWIELSGEIKAPSGAYKGKTLRQALEAVIADPRYQQFQDGDITYDGENIKMLKKVARSYRQAAKMQLAKQDPRFKEVFDKHTNQKKALKRPTTLIEDINNGSR